MSTGQAVANEGQEDKRGIGNRKKIKPKWIKVLKS